jgi:hypothetical protein
MATDKHTEKHAEHEAKHDPAHGLHKDTNKPRQEEIKSLGPNESPSNAHKANVAKVEPQKEPIFGEHGPIADTIGGVDPKRAERQGKVAETPKAPAAHSKKS